MISPAQRKQRQAAGRKSGKVRARSMEPTAVKGDPTAPMPMSSDPDTDRQLAAYDKLNGPVQSWPDARTREQVRGEIQRNEAAIRAARIESGSLHTAEQVNARDEARAQAFRTGLQSVGVLLTEHVPPDRLHDAQRAAREWIDGVLRGVNEAIKKGSGSAR